MDERMSAGRVLNTFFNVTVWYLKNGVEQFLPANVKPVTVWELDRMMSTLTRYRDEWGIMGLDIEEQPRRREPGVRLPWTRELREMYEREQFRYAQERHEKPQERVNGEPQSLRHAAC